MAKLYFNLIFILFFSQFSFSQIYPDFHNINLNDIKNQNNNLPTPKSNLKEWTIAVYMNGKSNIEPFALNDFNRFETVGSNDNVNIVVEIGRSKGLENDTDIDGDWIGVRRYYVKKDLDKEHINSELLIDLGNIDMGDWKESASFLLWTKQNFPAKKYMFIIWDHGWGWIDPKKPGENLINKSISHDFVSGNYIKTKELYKIFEFAGKVNLYASMACFMQMAEVAYELKNAADIIVGSEEVIQLPSFNFEDFLALMLKYPKVDAKTAGIFLVDTFKEMYSRPEYYQILVSGKYGTQLSALNAKELDEFSNYIKKIGEILKNYSDVSAISKAKKDVLRFEVGDEITDPDKLISFYADIYNFIELVLQYSQKNTPEYEKLFTIFEKFKSFINNRFIIKNVFLHKDRTGKDYSNTHGISMHIPGKKGNLIDYYPTYTDLSFDKVTRWSEVIKFLENIE